MASAVSRSKSTKLTHHDWAPHAAIPDVLKNSRLIRDQARRMKHANPLIDVCTQLYAEADALGHAQDDMAAVLTVIRNRLVTDKS